MKFDQTLMTFVRKDIDKNLIPMLLGEPGIGKSSWLMALAELMHTKCFVLACNQLADKADLTGARLVPVTDNSGNTVSYKQVFYPHAVIHDAIEYAKANPRETPILFMDELNRTTPDVTSEALSIPTLRKIGSSDLPANLRVVIAGNDKGNVTSLDEASVSRFVLYHVEPDTQTFLSLDANINVFVKNVLTAHPEAIFGKKLADVVASKKDDDDEDEVDINGILDDAEDMSQIATPRTISAVSSWLNSFTNQELATALGTMTIVDGQQMSALQEAIEGHVGHTLFGTLLLQEITNNLMNTNNQQNQAAQIGKPACYDAMKACKDITSLNTFVQGMSDNEKSGCMTYLLYEKADNTVFINALAPVITALQPEDLRKLMVAATSKQLDEQNIKALSNTNTGISNNLSILMMM